MLELPHRGSSNEYPQSIFLDKKIVLNGHVLLMSVHSLTTEGVCGTFVLLLLEPPSSLALIDCSKLKIFLANC